MKADLNLEVQHFHVPDMVLVSRKTEPPAAPMAAVEQDSRAPGTSG